MIAIYRKKELIAIMSVLIIAVLCVGCSTSTEQEVSESVSSVNTIEVTGYVISAYGNEIMLQLVDTNAGGMGQMSGERPQDGESANTGMQGVRGEISEGGMPEMPEGEKPEMTEGEKPEMAEGEKPEMAEGEASQISGDRTQMSGDRTQMSGDRTQMSGGMQSGMPEGGITDLSDLYPLSDEIVEYLIPVKTPVMQYGTEFTFSQITAEMYITIVMDENENIISIEVL